MGVTSAGILLYRPAHSGAGGLEVLVAHMGGPFWARKDEGAWSIPKGELDGDESPMEAARREFFEELGVPAPDVPYAELGTFVYSSGKRVVVFAAEGSGFAASTFVFGTFEMQWPPRSGRVQSFAEVDRAEWMTLDSARPRLVAGQRPALDALQRLVAAARAPAAPAPAAPTPAATRLRTVLSPQPRAAE